jgi:hypothetical protein
MGQSFEKIEVSQSRLMLSLASTIPQINGAMGRKSTSAQKASKGDSLKLSI